MAYQTWDDQLEALVFQTQWRQHQNKRLIATYAARQSALSAALHVLSAFISAPGPAISTLMAGFLVQSPSLFQSMIGEIARLYQAAGVQRGIILSEENEPASDLFPILPSLPSVQAISSTKEFDLSPVEAAVQQLHACILPRILMELVFYRQLLPYCALSTLVQTRLALCLTGRVAALCAAYFEHGQQWPGGSPEQTDSALLACGRTYTASVDAIPFLPDVCEGMVTRLLKRHGTAYEQSGEEIYQALHRLLVGILRLKFEHISFAMAE